MENAKEIALRSRNAEALAQRNADFLAKYDTDDKQIDYYTELAMKLFDEFKIDGTFSKVGVRKNVAEWFTNKQTQIARFRKHPYWDEEAKAIIFLQTETREINYRLATRFIEDIEGYIFNHIDDLSAPHWLISTLRMTLRILVNDYEETCDGTITDDFIRVFLDKAKQRVVCENVRKSLRKGMKITRFVRKCFENIVLSNGEVIDVTKMVHGNESFDKYYARFADSLSELQIERITSVSVNFLDFMTMSNGNSWSSCHFINSHNIFHEGTDSSYSGAYKQGCLSYALDEPSFLLYTLPTTFKDTDYYRCQKITRMCCQYDKGVLITGKCYPNNEDNLITRYRQMMQLIISHVENFPNLWVFSRKVDKIDCFVETARNSSHYRDYMHSEQKPTISICKSMDVDPLDTTITIGSSAYCLDCGESLSSDDNGWLQCYKHKRDRICSHCGVVLGNDDEYYDIDGEYYCADHVFFCEYHQQYEPIDNKYGEIHMRDGDKVVCSSAVRRQLQFCEDCGFYYPIEETEHGYCHECLKNNHHFCTQCGEFIVGDGFMNDNGEALCAICHTLASNRVKITKKSEYSVGDYVLMRNNVECCDYGANTNMETRYPNRIVQIRYTDGFGCYKVTNLDNHDWSWSANCFVGVVEDAHDVLIGKTIAECAEYFAAMGVQ